MEYVMPKNKKWEDDKLISVVNDCFSVAGVLTQLGLKAAGGNYKTIENAIRRLHLSTSHWTGQGHLKGKKHGWSVTIPLSAIMVENSTYTSTCKLKNRLLAQKLLTYECSMCFVSSWHGKALALHLDHANGINNDHRLENLRLLCPNCHSQTDTFAGKNKGKNGARNQT